MDKKLFLLDAMALIYRAHYAFIKNPRRTTSGMDTSAIYGFTNSLLEILKKEKPTHIGVSFDTPSPTFRHVRYAEYKANRDQQPEGISIAIPIIKQMLGAFQIPILLREGFEADDVIGTLAKKASKEGFKVYMMTPDKDYCQLLEEDKIFMFRPASRFAPNEVWDVAKALEKFQIKRVDQVRDMLGLQGDSVDNIPGVPGVGAKTAQKLIEEYDTIENLLEHTDELKGKLKERVEGNKDQALLSKELATIDIDVPIELDPIALKVKEFDQEKLLQLFDQLEFVNFKKKLFGKTAQPKTKKKDTNQMDLFAQIEDEEQLLPVNHKKDSLANIPHLYHLTDTPQKRADLIDYLKIQDEFCFDTETTGLNALNAELIGISFSYHAREAFYVPLHGSKEEVMKTLEEFEEVMGNTDIGKIGQNLKYDIMVLKRYGIDIKGKCFDTMLASYLLNPTTRHGMDFLASTHLGYETQSIESLIGKKGRKQGNMKNVDLQKIVEYAGEDADITFQLKQYFAPLLDKQPKLKKLFEEVEMPLVHVLADIEANGIMLDTKALIAYSKLLEEDIALLEKEIFALAGVNFKIASPKQLGEILFDHLKISHNSKKPKKTKTGQYATGEEILSKLAPDHEIVRKILEYRELQKLKSTYVDALPELILEDKKIHTSFNQAVVATGRLSSTNPNLQNIPIKTAKGREIRKSFIPSSPDHLLVAADYSQIELRLMASFSKDEVMLDAFANAKDIHSITAAKIFKIPLEEVTSDMRRQAKTANFSILYGSSSFNLANQLKIPTKQAKSLIDKYYEEFSSIKKYKEDMIALVRKDEYVETLLGRRRQLREINEGSQVMRGHAERNAVNTPIQGTAADLIKVAMIHVQNWIKEQGLATKMILQVHDELIFDVPKNEVDILVEHLPKLMTDAIPLDVKLEVEVGVGENWLEAH